MSKDIIPESESALSKLAKDPYWGSGFTKLEVHHAVEAAQRVWKRESEVGREYIPKLLDTRFEMWKQEKGLTHMPLKSILSMGEPLPERERQKEIEKRKPWECLPSWASGTPIGLFFHMGADDAHKSSSIYEGAQYFSSLAWLTIESAKELKDAHWVRSIVSAGLILFSFEVMCLDWEAKLQAKYAKAKFKQNASLFQFQKQKRLIEQQRIQTRKSQISGQADLYLQGGKSHKDIVSLIESHSNLNVSRRTIRRDLADHPSGHWASKTKKK